MAATREQGGGVGELGRTDAAVEVDRGCVWFGHGEGELEEVRGVGMNSVCVCVFGWVRNLPNLVATGKK